MSQISNCEFRIYNVLGSEVIQVALVDQSTTIETSRLPSGVYFYQLIGGNKLIQSGKLVSVK